MIVSKLLHRLDSGVFRGFRASYAFRRPWYLLVLSSSFAAICCSASIMLASSFSSRFSRVFGRILVAVRACRLDLSPCRVALIRRIARLFQRLGRNSDASSGCGRGSSCSVSSASSASSEVLSTSIDIIVDVCHASVVLIPSSVSSSLASSTSMLGRLAPAFIVQVVIITVPCRRRWLIESRLISSGRSRLFES
jgi:hypothetical protein